MTAVKILFYAINGTGLGHLNRLLIIARATRELVHCLGLKADFRFLTTSEADHFAWDFPTYKLPSKTVVGESDVISGSFAAQAKLLISNLVAGFRPDILVMDTLPQGSYQEFLFLKDYAAQTVFIDRHKDMRVRRGATHGATLALYDLILAPDHSDQIDQYPIPGNMLEKRLFTGPIHGFSRETAWSRSRVRAYFGVAPEQSLVYVSAGGGGDPHAAAQMRTLVETCAADSQRFVLAGYGPLYRGERIYGRNLVALSEPDAARFFPGLDAALCSAGYNSWHELLEAEVPCAFFPQNKGMDRQDLRIHGGVTSGWHLGLESVTRESVLEVLARLEDPPQRIRLETALSQRPRSNGALRAAVALLRLHSGLAQSSVRRQELHQAALMRLAWPDALAAQPAQTNMPSFIASFLNHKLWTRQSHSAAEREHLNDLALVAWEQASSTPLRLRHALRDGLALAGTCQRLELSDSQWQSLIKAYARNLPGKGHMEHEARLAGLCQDMDALAQQGTHSASALIGEALERITATDLAQILHELSAGELPLERLTQTLRAQPKRWLSHYEFSELSATLALSAQKPEPQFGGI